MTHFAKECIMFSDDIDKLRVFKDNVIVKVNEVKDIVADNGLIIPANVQQRSNNGRVFKIGPDVKRLKIGDHVCFVRPDVQINNQDYALVKEINVIVEWIEEE